MNPNRLFVLSDRRRLVNLSTRPLFQLKLPVMLLLISSLFLVIFIAHTQAAYGKLISAGFEHAFLADLASEIRFDYLVVSAALGIAWVLALFGACLAVTHRFLGPIVALRRQIKSLKRGEYAASAHIRAGHPLRTIADELDGLARLLSGEDLAILEEENALPPVHAAEPISAVSTEAPPLLSDAEPGLSLEPTETDAATPWIGWYARSTAASS